MKWYFLVIFCDNLGNLWMMEEWLMVGWVLCVCGKGRVYLDWLLSGGLLG